MGKKETSSDILNLQKPSVWLRSRQYWSPHEHMNCEIKPHINGVSFPNPSLPLWEFYELHKEKSIVRLLSSEYMCLGDIRSVKTIVWLRKPPQNELIFSNLFLAPSSPKKVFKTLKTSYIKPLLKATWINSEVVLQNSAFYSTKRVSSLIQHKNIKEMITWSLTASPLSSRQNCLKKLEDSSIKTKNLFSYWRHLIQNEVIHSDLHRSQCFWKWFLGSGKKNTSEHEKKRS